MKLLNVAVAVALGVSILNSADTLFKPGTVYAENAVNWSQGNDATVTADGYGAMPAGMPLAQAKMMARRAAILDAQRNLVSELKGVQVDAESTMNNYIIQSDKIQTKVSGLLTGARVNSEGIDSAGGYKVTMAVPMYGVGSVADVAYNAVFEQKQLSAVPLEVPKPDVSFEKTYTVAATSYTGLIIDAQGLGLEPTFCPAIFDENGRAIYGVHNVDKDYAISHGVAEYTNDKESALKAASGFSRAGNNPLIIKATKAKVRIANACDVVVSVEDGNRILAENTRSNFMSKYAVVIEK